MWNIHPGSFARLTFWLYFPIWALNLLTLYLSSHPCDDALLNVVTRWSSLAYICVSIVV